VRLLFIVFPASTVSASETSAILEFCELSTVRKSEGMGFDMLLGLGVGASSSGKYTARRASAALVDAMGKMTLGGVGGD
jgi:hypothetical protein